MLHCPPEDSSSADERVYGQPMRYAKKEGESATQWINRRSAPRRGAAATTGAAEDQEGRRAGGPFGQSKNTLRRQERSAAALSVLGTSHHHGSFSCNRGHLEAGCRPRRGGEEEGRRVAILRPILQARRVRGSPTVDGRVLAEFENLRMCAELSLKIRCVSPPNELKRSRRAPRLRARNREALGGLEAVTLEMLCTTLLVRRPSQRHADGTTNAAGAAEHPPHWGCGPQNDFESVGCPLGAKLKHPTAWPAQATAARRRRRPSASPRRRRPCRTARAAVATARAAWTSRPRNNVAPPGFVVRGRRPRARRLETRVDNVIRRQRRRGLRQAENGGSRR